MKTSFLTLFALFGFLCLCTPSYAQIVNIESKRVVHVDSSEWYGRLNLGFNLIENGNSIINFNGGANLEYVKGHHWFLALTNFNFIQIEKEDFINDGFLHFRYNYSINKFLSYEAFTQAQYNEKLNLQLRWLLGTGLRFALVNKKDHNAYLGVSYMYEYNEETSPELEFRDHRMSSYFSFSIKPFKNARFTGTSYFQPVLNDFNDLRLSSQSALAIDLTKNLKFTTTLNITYDSRVPEDVVNTIYSFRNGIRLDF